MVKRIKTAVIGVGYLGQFHAEKYAQLPQSDLIAVVDASEQNARSISDKLGVKAYTDYTNLLGHVDAVSIVTPTSSHYAIAKVFLEQGIHVLLEKPMTTTLDEADELIKLARAHHCVLQVGHLERFNPALMGAQKLMTRPVFIEAHRLAPYKPRATDVNVVLDLMIHDIDIILNLVKSDIKHIVASGAKVLSPSTDICNARIDFENGCVANVTASRISHKSERKMRIFQEQSCLTVDFQNRVLNHYYTDANTPRDEHSSPAILSQEQQWDSGDALLSEINSFLNSIQNNEPPLVTGEDGRKALFVAAEINKMVKTCH